MPASCEPNDRSLHWPDQARLHTGPANTTKTWMLTEAIPEQPNLIKQELNSLETGTLVLRNFCPTSMTWQTVSHTHFMDCSSRKLTPLRDNRPELSKGLGSHLLKFQNFKISKGSQMGTLQTTQSREDQYLLFICWGRGWGEVGHGDGGDGGGAGEGCDLLNTTPTPQCPGSGMTTPHSEFRITSVRRCCESQWLLGFYRCCYSDALTFLTAQVSCASEVTGEGDVF